MMTDKMQTQELLIDLYRQMKAEEGNAKGSPKYLTLENEKLRIENEMDDLMEGYRQKEEAYEAVKSQVIQTMKDEGLDNIGSIIAKYREKKEVNNSMLIDALGGDIGLYMELATVPQTKLKDYIKSTGKSGLKNCIKVVSREIVDITF